MDGDWFVVARNQQLNDSCFCARHLHLAPSNQRRDSGTKRHFYIIIIILLPCHIGALPVHAHTLRLTRESSASHSQRTAP